MPADLALDVYGLRANVSGDWPEVVGALATEYAWFAREDDDGQAALHLVVERQPPDYGRWEDLRAAFVTPRNVVYQGGAVTVVDYFGRALLVLDRADGRATLQGVEEGLVREAASNLLVSRVGEHLNAHGFVRLHALGLSGAAGGVAVTMPSGGGKSTLALQALSDGSCKLLSDDSPLIDRHGSLHPFPLRIGVNPPDVDLVPEGHPTRLVERLEFHPKLVLDVASFRDRVEPTAVPLRHLVLGRRTLSERGLLQPVRRRAAVSALVREAVVGIGVYQGMEFVLQRGWRDVAGKSGVAARRAVVAAAALRQARVWILWLGRDRESNWEALRPLLAQESVPR